MSTAKTCPHLDLHPDLEVLLVTDATVTLADAFVKCRSCGQDYLIELIDIKGPASAFRMAALPAQALWSYVADTKNVQVPTEH